MCKAVVKFTPVIELLFPTNTALQAALVAANAACAELASELRLVRDYGD